MSALAKVIAYVDGSCQPNPGPGGAGIVLKYGEHIKQAGIPLPLMISGQKTTNNRAELLAAIHALEMLKRPCEITIYSDSQWVVMCATRAWGRHTNTDLWQRFDKAAEGHTVRFEWVKGHNGNPDNERAHTLAYNAIPRGSKS